MEPKFFSREQANALVPYLNLQFASLGRLRPEIRELTEHLGGADEALAFLNGEQATPANLEPYRVRLAQITDEVRGVVSRVTDLGVVVKDLDLGLVDFYGRREGRVVFLCWMFGEREVGHWHELDDGFDGRLPIGAPKPVALPN